VVVPIVVIVAVGKAFTVTTDVVLFVQPPAVTVYVIVDVPELTPVTCTEPKFGTIVATAKLLDVQVPPDVILDNVVVDPVHTAVVPVIDATTGNAVTVTAVAELVAEHPSALVTVTV
jgi:hypothetical protein